jgi:hypothetical protein
LHIEDDLREAFIEDARLDFERNLGRLEIALELSEGSEGSGREKDAVA